MKYVRITLSTSERICTCTCLLYMRNALIDLSKFFLKNQYLGSNTLANPHKILLTTHHALLGKVQYVVERRVKGLEIEPALRFIRSLDNDALEEASDDDLRSIIEVAEGNTLLIKLFVTRLFTAHLPLAFVLAELQAVNQRLGRNIIDYLYAESLSVLEQLYSLLWKFVCEV